MVSRSAEDEILLRCVRGGQPYEGAPIPRLSRSEPVVGAPVVSDAVTGLLWQGCDAGLAGTDCAGSGVSMDWQQALAYCEGSSWGGFTDWRLPNVKELRSLIDDHREDPRLDPGVFPSPVVASYWSSTSADYWYGGSVGGVEPWGGALVVPNSLGLVHTWRKLDGADVLCVRQVP